MTAAIIRARTGGGPTLIEAMTYRLRGHTRYDAMGYIATGEVASKIENDPAPRFRACLIEQGHATEDELKELDEQGVKDVEDAWDPVALHTLRSRTPAGAAQSEEPCRNSGRAGAVAGPLRC